MSSTAGCRPGRRRTNRSTTTWTVEDVPGAAYEAEHLGDVHGVARPRVGEQFAELRALEGVEAAGGARVLLEDDGALDAGLVQDEVLPGGGLLVGRDPFVDQVRHRGPVPYEGSDLTCRQTLSAITIGSDWIRAAANSRISHVHWTHRLPVVKRSFSDRRKLAGKQHEEIGDRSVSPHWLWSRVDEWLPPWSTGPRRRPRVCAYRRSCHPPLLGDTV